MRFWAKSKLSNIKSCSTSFPRHSRASKFLFLSVNTEGQSLSCPTAKNQDEKFKRAARLWNRLLCLWLRSEDWQMPIIEQFFTKLTKAVQPPEMFHKKKVFVKIPQFSQDRNHLCWSQINAAQMFSCEYCKIFSNNCFEEHLHTATSENYIKHISWKGHRSQLSLYGKYGWSKTKAKDWR